VLDLVGGNYLEGNLRVLGSLGRIVVVGLTSGATAPFNMGVLLRKRLTIVGTMLRGRPVEEKIALAREFSDRIIPLFENGRLKPVIDRRFPLGEVVDALRHVDDGRAKGKVVITL